MAEQTQPKTQSFAEYVERMHDKDRSVAVFVEGELSPDPQRGNAAATRIAHFLCSEGEEPIRMEPGNVTEREQQEPEDIGAVQVRLLPGSKREQWTPVQQRLLSRMPRDTDIVVLVDTHEVPWFLKDLGDVRVVADSIDDPLEFYRVKLDHYSGDVYFHEMNGFHGDANGD